MYNISSSSTKNQQKELTNPNASFEVMPWLLKRPPPLISGNVASSNRLWRPNKLRVGVTLTCHHPCLAETSATWWACKAEICTPDISHNWIACTFLFRAVFFFLKLLVSNLFLKHKGFTKALCQWKYAPAVYVTTEPAHERTPVLQSCQLLQCSTTTKSLTGWLPTAKCLNGCKQWLGRLKKN